MADIKRHLTSRVLSARYAQLRQPANPGIITIVFAFRLIFQPVTPPLDRETQGPTQFCPKKTANSRQNPPADGSVLGRAEQQTHSRAPWSHELPRQSQRSRQHPNRAEGSVSHCCEHRLRSAICSGVHARPKGPRSNRWADLEVPSRVRHRSKTTRGQPLIAKVTKYATCRLTSHSADQSQNDAQMENATSNAQQINLVELAKRAAKLAADSAALVGSTW